MLGEDTHTWVRFNTQTYVCFSLLMLGEVTLTFKEATKMLHVTCHPNMVIISVK